MRCLKCHSKDLEIRQPTGFELVMIFLTGNRKFRCRDCWSQFRAPDRRAVSREADFADADARAIVILR